MIINGTLTTVNIALLPVDNYSQSCITLAEAGDIVALWLLADRREYNKLSLHFG